MNDQTESAPPPDVPEPGEEKQSTDLERLIKAGLIGAVMSPFAFLLAPFAVLGLLEGGLSFKSKGGEIPGTSAEADGLEIRARIQTWAGGPEEAGRWYRSQPIAAFGDRTAESLVKSGQAEALRDYLDSIALGGYS